MIDNLIYIGNRDFKSYNSIILKKLSQNRDVIVKTRGKYVSKAINIVTFLEKIGKLKIKSTKIFCTEYYLDNIKKFTSEIEIVLTRK